MYVYITYSCKMDLIFKLIEVIKRTYHISFLRAFLFCFILSSSFFYYVIAIYRDCWIMWYNTNEKGVSGIKSGTIPIKDVNVLMEKCSTKLKSK